MGKRKNYGKNHDFRGSAAGGARPFLLRRRRCRTAKPRPVRALVGPWPDFTGPASPDRGSRPLPPTPSRENGPTRAEPGRNLGRTLRSMGFRRFLRYLCFCLNFCSSSGVSSRMLGQHSRKPGQHRPKMAQPSAQDGPT